MSKETIKLLPESWKRSDSLSKDSTSNVSYSKVGFIEENSEHVKSSLENANPFVRRRLAACRLEERLNVLVISTQGESTYREISLWSLYAELLDEIRAIDTKYLDKDELSDASDHASTTRKARKRILSGCTNDFRIRDLRWLEGTFPEQDLTILVRRHITLVIWDPIRALVMSNKLILIVPQGADSLIGTIEKYMSEWEEEIIMDGGFSVNIPFELHAYEAVFTTVKILQSKRLERIQIAGEELLSQTKKGSLLPLNLQEDMRELKNVASRMSVKLDRYQKALHELIMNDEDMALMNLTTLRSNPLLYRTPLSVEILSQHEEVEELLQSFVMDYNSLAASLEVLREQIQNAEDLVSLRLDTSRNELLIANTAFSLGACCVGLGGYLAGLFGMNLDNTISIQDTPGLFVGICIGSSLTIIASYVGVFWYLSFTGVLPTKAKVASHKAVLFLD